jgi:Flp pilus assembly CpaF family ATPase
MSFETILPFLQPIASLITDPGVSEVMVNGDGAIFSEAGKAQARAEKAAQALPLASAGYRDAHLTRYRL